MTRLLLLLAIGCSAPHTAPVGGPDATPPGADASGDAVFSTDAADWTHYRTSISSCWNDVACPRALVIAHGGDWSLADPAYGTTAAYDAAYANDADALKADVRFSKDGVAVVVHSSPFASYEIDPLDFSCLGATVENMNVSDIVQCKWINGDHVQRLDDLLTWSSGKLIVMLTVKVPATIPQTIAQVVASGATDRAFLEVSTSAMTTIVQTNHDNVRFVVEAANATDIQSLITLGDPRAFLYEDANSDNFGGMTIATAIATIHTAGFKAFTSISGVTGSASDHETLWNEGFDVVMTNSYSAGHTGRIAVNTARGVSPP
jgi:glycerophosphoryl diester phosphodiesterase